jgi:pimeloyl-ACP methyl ester carboxylesterase
MLPLSLHEAANGRPEMLAAQARMLTSMLGESIMHGMQLSVICTEDAPGLQVNPADAGTVIGSAMIEVIKAQCAVWPAGTLAPDFHEPLASDAPVLLISGEFDPVTPPRYGETALAQFANGRHLVLRGQGHNVVGTGCMPRLLGQFIESTDAKAMDAKCLEQLDYTPPFAGYYGWEP